MAKSYYKVDNSTTVEMDQLFVTTMDRRAKQLVDQIFKKNIALAFLLSMKDTTMIQGGKQFIVPLEVEENPHGGWINDEEGIPMDDYDPVDAAIYGPKSLSYNVRFSREQRFVNRGDVRVHSLMSIKERNTIKSMQKRLEEAIWTGDGTNQKVMDGLPKIIPATVPASQSVTVGGISPSSKSWWRTQARNMSGMAAAAELEAELLTLYNDIALEGGTVNMNFTSQDIAETYEKNQMDYLSVGMTKVGDFNFETIKYKGGPISFSDLAPAGEWRMVDKEALIFAVDPAYWMRWTKDKEQVDNPFTSHRQILSRCNLCRREARTLGCIYNITAG